jgi:predicted nuclease with TOPRIM domain
VKKDTALNSLQDKLRTQQNDLKSFHAENTRLQSQYDSEMTRIQQLERELSDLLHYHKNILEKMQVAESYASGHGSRLGSIKLVRHGQLEGRFLERMQSRLSDRHRKQADAVEAIRENMREIKSKSQLIEYEIEDARKYAMQVDNLISTNRDNIRARKVQIAQLEGRIRVMT